MKSFSIKILLGGILLYSCAQKVPLSGGDKDVTPPSVKTFEPANESTNFTAEKITIEFDEFIKLNNLGSKLIVSPLMKETPEIKVQNKKLIIDLPDSLLPNTTYSINFGDAIQDVTEGNQLSNFKYVFATGNQIDSLVYAGNVANTFSQMPEEGVLVMLYNSFEDSLPLTTKPQYIAKTNKNGEFTINNIAAGSYKTFALRDINSNYLFDLPNEEIAFLDNIINIDSSIYDTEFQLFEEDNNSLAVIKSSSTSYGKIELEFNNNADKISFEAINDSSLELIVEDESDNHKKVVWINENPLPENIDLVVKNGGEILDTLSVKLTTQLKDSALVLTTNTPKSFDLNEPISITSNNPIKVIDVNKIKLYADSVAVPFTLIKDSLSPRKTIFDITTTPKTNYSLFAEPDAFIGINGLANDSLLKEFKTKKENDYGSLMVKLNIDNNESYFLQLIEKEKVIKEVSETGNKNITFDFLKPGNYQLKLIIDSNKNGKWDSGKYTEKSQPEPVLFYSGAITVTENWGIEQEWIVE